MSLFGRSTATDIFLFAAGSITMAASLARYGRLLRPAPQKQLVASMSVQKQSSPNAPWQEGSEQPIPYENATFKSYLSSDLRKSGGLYSLAISSIVPRPIALVTSQDQDGNINCAPYSYFNLVSHDPPMIVIGNSLNVRSDIKKKDTLRNIEETGQFVVNIMSDWYVESANHCCGAFPHGINEMKVAGLSSLASELVKPPRVGNAAVQFECEVFQIIPLSNDDNVHTSSLVLGKILKFHILEEVLTKESKDSLKPIVDWRKLRPIARLGGETYSFVNNGFDIPRPKV